MIQPKTILYGATKCALTYFMKGLARELDGTGIIAGRLSPGMMLTDFITKTPDGEQSEVISDEKFRKVFNILADKPETVAKFFVPKMLSNTKNNFVNPLCSRKRPSRMICISYREPTEPIMKDAAELIFSTWQENGRFRLYPEGSIYPCQTINAANTLYHMGFVSDAKLQKTFQHLLDIQNVDGGWRCNKFSFGRGPETECSTLSQHLLH